MRLGEVLLLMTRGFQFEIDQPTQAKILEKGLERIHPKAPGISYPITYKGGKYVVRKLDEYRIEFEEVLEEV